MACQRHGLTQHQALTKAGLASNSSTGSLQDNHASTSHSEVLCARTSVGIETDVFALSTFTRPHGATFTLNSCAAQAAPGAAAATRGCAMLSPAPALSESMTGLHAAHHSKQHSTSLGGQHAYAAACACQALAIPTDHTQAQQSPQAVGSAHPVIATACPLCEATTGMPCGNIPAMPPAVSQQQLLLCTGAAGAAAQHSTK